MKIHLRELSNFVIIFVTIPGYGDCDLTFDGPCDHGLLSINLNILGDNTLLSQSSKM